MQLWNVFFWWFYLWATRGHQCAQGCCTPSCPLHTPNELSTSCWRHWLKTWICWTRRDTLPLDLWPLLSVEIPGFEISRKILLAPTPAMRYNIAERRSDGGSLWWEWRAIGTFSIAVSHCNCKNKCHRCDVTEPCTQVGRFFCYFLALATHICP